MEIERFSTRGFRNLAPQELSLGPGVTLLVGSNGAGKSNLLEAVTVLGNLSSFRSTSGPSLVRWGESGFSLAGTIRRAGVSVSLRQETRVSSQLQRRLFRGARRLSMGEYLQLFPVAALSSFDRALIVGGPEERRRFLDRLTFHLHPEALRLHQQYRRALRQRASALVSGGEGEIEAFEHLLAGAGAQMIEWRLQALRRLVDALEVEMELLQWSMARAQVRYHAGDGLSGLELSQLAVRLRQGLERSRRQDAQQRRTSVGPHRHDLAITISGVPAREALSAGQGKLLAVALRLAGLAVLEERLGGAPVVVFDDVDAELDVSALGRVLARLRGRAQVLISSARPELVMPSAAPSALWRVEAGQVQGDGVERRLS